MSVSLFYCPTVPSQCLQKHWSGRTEKIETEQKERTASNESKQIKLIFSRTSGRYSLFLVTVSEFQNSVSEFRIGINQTRPKSSLNSVCSSLLSESYAVIVIDRFIGIIDRFKGKQNINSNTSYFVMSI